MSSTLNLRYGKTVPDGGINLAWVTFPEISPSNNVYLSNVASTSAANIVSIWRESLSDDSLTSWSVSVPKTTGLTRAGNTAKTLRYMSTPIEVLSPVEDETGAWYLRIMDGTFRVTAKLTSQEFSASSRSWVASAATDAGWKIGDTLMFIYGVQDSRLVAGPATSTSDPDSYARVMQITDEEAAVVDSNCIQLSNGEVIDITSITINGGTNLLKENSTAYKLDKSCLSTTVVDDTDLASGLITLNRTMSSSDIVLVTYRYRGHYFIYRGFFDDDNPTVSKRRFVDLDLNPSFGHVYDGSNPTVGSSSTRGLLDSVVYVYALPSAAFLYEAADGLSGAIVDGKVNIYRAMDYGVTNVIRWQAAPVLTNSDITPSTNTTTTVVTSLRTWLGAYGVANYSGNYYFTSEISEADPERTIDTDSGWGLRVGGVGELAEYPSAFVLAKVFVSPACTINTVNVVDTRRRGGGVTDDASSRKALFTGDKLSEANACWDNSAWDGEPVMLNSTVVFDIPQAMLETSGITSSYRKFTESEIYEIVKRSVPAGIKPVLRFV